MDNKNRKYNMNTGMDLRIELTQQWPLCLFFDY